MSRVGNAIISVPKGVEVKISGQHVSVKGPKGLLERDLHNTMTLTQEGEILKVVPKHESKLNRKFHGLTRALVNNMVVGVSEGFTKSLSLVGVGYRAQPKGSAIQFTLGYSHPIMFEPPKGIDVKVEKQTTVIVSGPDKEAVGQVAANIRSYRKPEPYHGKGVRYTDEHISTKVGKSGSK